MSEKIVQLNEEVIKGHSGQSLQTFLRKNLDTTNLDTTNLDTTFGVG